jgi:Glycosyl transferase family 90
MMMQASYESSEKKRRRRKNVTIGVVLMLVFVSLRNELQKSFQLTGKYNREDQSRFATELMLQETMIFPSATVSTLDHRETPKIDTAGDDASHTDAQDSQDMPHNDATNEASQKNTSKKVEAVGKEQRNLNYAYLDASEMQARPTRFPSVDDRVKLYMSNWYTPPCPSTDDDARVSFEYTKHNHTIELLTLQEIAVPSERPTPRTFQLNSHFLGSSVHGSFDQVHFMDRDAMLECKHRYCKDMAEFLIPALDRQHRGVSDSDKADVPMLYQFGDADRTKALRLPRSATDRPQVDRYPNMPVLKKMRKSISRSELKRMTSESCFKSGERITPVQNHLEPVIFKLKTQRHYGRIYRLASMDVPWEEKKNTAIFRGELNGNYPLDYVTGNKIPTLTVHERCRLLERCWIVYQHATNSSSLVDAKLTLPYKSSNSKLIPRFIRLEESNDDATFDLYGDTVSLVDMLQYKALIMLEGNDVSSGLKWALFSNSVVLMPKPTLTSWAMEEILEPWVHYVPIDVYKSTTGRATTDVEEKMQWIVDNDDKARQIAQAGKLWISDLVLHPDVSTDEAAIFDEMLRRYAAHFVHAATSQ